MLKKITAILILSIFTNTHAFTIHDELDQISDALNYRLNTEWNQTDVHFFNETMTLVEKELMELEAQGLSKQELLNYTLKKIKDRQLHNDLLALDRTVLTEEEIRAFTYSKLSATYAHGASWYGRRLGAHAPFLIGALVIMLVTRQRTGSVHECEYPSYPDYGNNTWGDCYPQIPEEKDN